jgi:exocyst complex component 3
MRLVRKVANTDTSSRFKSMQANARVIKNYRHKFLDAMTASIRSSFEAHYEEHQYDLLAFIETLGWIYKDIIRIKDDVEPLFPQDYEITPYLVKAYHKALNDTMRSIVASAPEAKVLLELHAWIKEYRQSMKELEIPSAWLQPPLLDGKSQDLIEDYVKLIRNLMNGQSTLWPRKLVNSNGGLMSLNNSMMANSVWTV